MSVVYRGRFAPSPTGPLHFGSIVSALASFLDAKKHQGKWLVRIEDVDGTRCKPHYIDSILTTLSSYHLLSDEPVRIQSQHLDIYEAHLIHLQRSGMIYPCNCTRQSLTAFHGHHPYQCNSNMDLPHSWRLHTDNRLYQYPDDIQGVLSLADLKNSHPVLKRKDGYFSYQLAVVVDDHLQDITHLVRGSDLIETTAQQLFLYDVFKWKKPKISHIPLITNTHHHKVSKQNHARPIENGDLTTLKRALHYLQIDVNSATSIQAALTTAIRLWNPEKLSGKRYLPLEKQDQQRFL